MATKFPFQKLFDIITIDDNEEEMYKYQLINYIMTNKGERLNDPNYGFNGQYYVDEPINEKLKLNMVSQLYSDIGKYFPKIQIIKINVFTIEEIENQEILKQIRNEDQQNVLFIYIEFGLLTTAKSASLTIPYKLSTTNT